MYCKWCGMESKNSQKCEWCGKPLSDNKAGNETIAMNVEATQTPPTSTPKPQGPQRMRTIDDVGSGTGVAGWDGSAASDGAVTDATQSMRPLGSPTPAPPRPTYTPPTLPAFAVEIPQIAPFGVRMEKFLASILLPIGIGMLVSHYVAGSMYWLLLALVFLTGLMLGVTRTGGYYENDDGSDALIALVLAGLVGPVYALVGSLLIGLMKRNPHWTIIGILSSVVVIQILLSTASDGAFIAIGSALGFSVSLGLLIRIITAMPVILAFAGWFCASFTRPLNEN